MTELANIPFHTYEPLLHYGAKAVGVVVEPPPISDEKRNGKEHDDDCPGSEIRHCVLATAIRQEQSHDPGMGRDEQQRCYHQES